MTITSYFLVSLEAGEEEIRFLNSISIMCQTLSLNNCSCMTHPQAQPVWALLLIPVSRVTQLRLSDIKMTVQMPQACSVISDPHVKLCLCPKPKAARM